MHVEKYVITMRIFQNKEEGHHKHTLTPAAMALLKDDLNNRDGGHKSNMDLKPGVDVVAPVETNFEK